MQEGGLAGLTCVQDVWQDGDYTQLTVLAGLLHHVFIQDLTQKHSWEMPQSGQSSGRFLLLFQVLFVFLGLLLKKKKMIFVFRHHVLIPHQR